MRRPIEFQGFVLSYEQARNMGFFRGYCHHVVDGDTFDVLIDLGLGKYAYDTIRLYGIDTPEINSGAPDERARGQLARQLTSSLILDNQVLL
jgi:endonuclease YncB( thermonuclease family)